MTKMFVHLILALFVLEASAQTSLDMVVLRNRQNRTIKSFFSGIPITFGDKTGQVVQGVIKRVYNDSIFIQQYDIRRAATMWGTPVQDTIGTYFIKFHPNEIVWIAKPRQIASSIRNGSAFMIGGAGYAVLHVLNAAYLGQPVLWPNMAIAGGVVAAGYLLKMLHSDRYMMGKKYKLIYINTTPSK